MIESILIAVPIVSGVIYLIYVLDQLDKPGGTG